MAGDLSERIHDKDTNGDYRRLTENINKMLDTIEDLMIGVRRISDNIAHDLRTPLTRIRNQLAELESSCKEENRDQLEQLISEADHLLATFSALLRISQVESGNKREGFTEIGLSQILSDVAEMYEPLAYDKQQSFEMKLDTVPGIMGDRNLLFQVLANLVDNAIKYTPVEGHVGVSAECVGSRVIITVSDSGMGIPEEDREKVFQRFYRIEQSRGLPGNGLGLSLVRAVVRLHLGQIDLQDNQPGLRVVLSFPIGGKSKKA
jgi:signal transduction histidine kinase